MVTLTRSRSATHVTATPAASPSTTEQTPMTSTPPTSAISPGAAAASCRSDQLRAELKGLQGAAGNLVAAFWLANTSPVLCVLRSPLRLSLLDAAGDVMITAERAFTPILLSANGSVSTDAALPSGQLAVVRMSWPTDANAAASQGDPSGRCPTPEIVPQSAQIAFNDAAAISVASLRDGDQQVRICGTRVSVTIEHFASG